jgi:hypothetical protein
MKEISEERQKFEELGLQFACDVKYMKGVPPETEEVPDNKNQKD